MSLPTTSVAFSSSTPAAPAGQQDIVIQSDGGTPQQKISGYDRIMVGDTGAGGLAGNVPAPDAGDAAAGKVLKADGTWVVPPGKIVRITLRVASGSALTPGDTKTYPEMDVNFAGTITGWSLTADQVGSVSVDVWKVASSAPPSAPTIPSSANKISASAGPALTSAQSASQNAAGLTGWTTAVAANDVFGFNIASASSVTAITLQIWIQRS